MMTELGGKPLGQRVPLISIITPTFNHAKFIGQCVESVLAQAYTNWEQFVIDDGSTDETSEIVARYRDRRVRYVHMPHRGLSSLAETYNIALEMATGDLVAILEGDDVWPSNKLASQVQVFEDENVYLSWGKSQLIDERGRPIEVMQTVRPRDHITAFSNRWIFRKLTMDNILAPAVAVMTRRSVLQRIGGFHQTDATCFADLPTWLLLTGKCVGKVCFIDDDLGWYRIHPGQVTNTQAAQIPADHLRTVLDMVRRLDPGQVRALGWGPNLMRRAVVAAKVREGKYYLKQGRLKDARKRFLEAMTVSVDILQSSTAVVGFLSTLTNVDLFASGRQVVRLFRLR